MSVRRRVISGSSTPVVLVHRASTEKSGSSTPVYCNSNPTSAQVSGAGTPRGLERVQERHPPDATHAVPHHRNVRASWPTLMLVKKEIAVAPRPLLISTKKSSQEGRGGARPCRSPPRVPRVASSHQIRADHSAAMREVSDRNPKPVIRMGQSSVSESARSTAAGSNHDDEVVTPLSSVTTEVTVPTDVAVSLQGSLQVPVAIGSPVAASPRYLLEDGRTWATKSPPPSPSVPQSCRQRSWGALRSAWEDVAREHEGLREEFRRSNAELESIQDNVRRAGASAIQQTVRLKLQRIQADIDSIRKEIDPCLLSSPTPAVGSEARASSKTSLRRPRAQAPSVARSLSAASCSSQEDQRLEDMPVLDARTVLVQPPTPPSGFRQSRSPKPSPLRLTGREKQAGRPPGKDDGQRQAAREALERAIERFESYMGCCALPGAWPWHHEAVNEVPVARAWAARDSLSKAEAQSSCPSVSSSSTAAVEAATTSTADGAAASSPANASQSSSQSCPSLSVQPVGPAPFSLSPTPLQRRRGSQPGQGACPAGRASAGGAATAGGTTAPRGGRQSMHRSPVGNDPASETVGQRVPLGSRQCREGSSPPRGSELRSSSRRLGNSVSESSPAIAAGRNAARVSGTAATGLPLGGNAMQVLRNALQGAQTVGLYNYSDERLIARAQALLGVYDDREEAARKELREAVAQTQGLVESRWDSMKCLKEAKDRLNSAILGARGLGLAESELREAEKRRRKVHNMMEDLKGQIRVFCRVRPLSQKERSEGDFEVLQCIDDMTLEVPSNGSFAYDAIFAPGEQQEVFEECCDLIQSAVDGHNVTIFAYGQTGAGKTYTMNGTPAQEGIAPRAIMELFKIIDRVRAQSSVTVTGSMVELYNNHLVDLLRPVTRRGSLCSSPKLSVRQDRAGSVQVQEMKEQEVKDAAQLKALLDRGIAQRTVAANAMNIESSRSHLIFTIRVSSVNHETKEILKGKILLCDLGGSERLKKTEATGDRKTEAIEINKSLTALGDVIEAVAKKQKQVPYRNHKLTQIMQDSLGGTAKTLMFVNCSPAQSSLDETVPSLKYAARVKRITNWASPSHSPTRPHSPWGSPQGSRSASVSRCPSAPRRGMSTAAALDDLIQTAQ